MSQVTSVVLIIDLLEDLDNIRILNDWLKARSHLQLIAYGADMPGRGLDLRLYSIAINHLDLEDFISLVRRTPWIHRSEVVLILNMEGFRKYMCYFGVSRNRYIHEVFDVMQT